MHKWCETLNNDKSLQYLTNYFEPCVFLIITTLLKDLQEKSSKKEFHSNDYFKKLKGKPKKREKLINYSRSKTYYLFDKYKNGTECIKIEKYVKFNLYLTYSKF